MALPFSHSIIFSFNHLYLVFRFEYISNLNFLLLLPVLLLLIVVAWRFRKKALERFGNIDLLQRLIPGYSEKRQFFKFALLLFGLAFLIVGWANPQFSGSKEKVKRKGVDIYIALDISKSMLAEDVAPSRLERAKRFAGNLLEELAGNRIGMLYFAGNAYLQIPLTIDYSAAAAMLKSANPNLASAQGTAIGEAVDFAMKGFEVKDQQNKVLIIISDGEDHDESAIEKVQEAREKGMLVFTAGVGTPEGGLIPIRVGNRQDYQRDETGNAVKSQLNEEMMINIAEAGGGSYFNLLENESAIFNTITDRIEKMQKQEFEQRSFTSFDSYFQWLLFPAFLLFLIEFLLPGRGKVVEE